MPAARRARASHPGQLLFYAAAVVTAAGLSSWISAWDDSTVGAHDAPPARTAARAAPAPVAAPAPREKTPGSEWLAEYAAVDAMQETTRHRLVLEQVAQRNMPDSWDDWVTVTVTGQKGTVVEFEVSPHGLRIGTTEDWVEVPLDAPHSAAAAEILGVRLAPAWMIEGIRRQARRSGGAVHYFAASEIAQAMGDHEWRRNAPDGPKMKSPEFFAQRSALLRAYLAEHGIQDGVLVSGYFKSIVPPIDGLTRRSGLEIVGGCSDQGEQIQPLSGGLHATTFYDYSHNIRLVKDGLRVNGARTSFSDFSNSVRYAREFRFRRSSVPEPAYRYPEELAHWMRSRGYGR